ncbi:MAG: hypothetical protein ACJ8D9_25260 [Xanthobacteraceae bacterium]
MRAKIALLTVALGLIGLGDVHTASAQSNELGLRADQAYAQARPRIRVTPRCPYRTTSVPYPTPAECDFPGPGYVRQCNAQLVREYRPSGTVIVPVQRCWWEPGRG